MTYKVYHTDSMPIGRKVLAEVASLEAGIEWLANEYKDRELVYSEIDRDVEPHAYDAFYGPKDGDDGVIVFVQMDKWVSV